MVNEALIWRNRVGRVEATLDLVHVMAMMQRIGVFALGASLASTPAQAAGLDGASLSPLWAVPFAGLLLSIALAPLVVAQAWHAHYGKVAAFWAALTTVGLVARLGAADALATIVHTGLGEYLPFILLLTALFVAAGGLVVRGNLHGAPMTNVALLAIGSALASLIGTTGAAMVLIRPLLRANDDRRHNAHVVVFFIFLVANIGGALSPLGDPPLFLGFLRGVPFDWPLRHLWPETLVAVGVLLAVFWAIDAWVYRREGVVRPDPSPDDERLALTGTVNIALIGVVVAAIVVSGVWRPGPALTVLGTTIAWQDLLRDGVLVLVIGLSLKLTNPASRAANGFEWAPIVEVAKLFAAIFVTIIPVLAMLEAGRDGPFGAIVAAVTDSSGAPRPAAFFWATGVLSSFLDNAPTYLVFFELAHGDPAALTGPLARTLAAISLGAVLMGANTYIGNAPNFMVYAIARRSGVRMPSFFGYMLWSGCVLVPLFALITWMFLLKD